MCGSGFSPVAETTPFAGSLGFFGLVFVFAPGTSVLPFPHKQTFVNSSFDLEYGIEEAYIVCAITFKNRMRNYLLIASIDRSFI